MKTNLPESRNRNLPVPPAAAAPLQKAPPLSHLPPAPPQEGPSVLRSLVVLTIIVALLGTGIFIYMRHAMSDAELVTSIETRLKLVGSQIWKMGGSQDLFADTEEARKDMEDLPRVVMAVRANVKNAEPDITVVEVDPGKDLGAHHIIYRVRDVTVLVVRTRYDKVTGQFQFIEEKNGINASRKDQKFPAAVSDRSGSPVPSQRPVPFQPGVNPLSPAPLQPGVNPATPAPPVPATPPPVVPAVPPSSGEKVSEQP